MLGVRRRGKVCLAANISWTGGLRWGASFEVKVRMWIGKRFWWDHVAKRIINHLPHPHNIDYRWYKPFPNAIDDCFTLGVQQNSFVMFVTWKRGVCVHAHGSTWGVTTKKWRDVPSPKDLSTYTCIEWSKHLGDMTYFDGITTWQVCDLKPTHEWDKSGGEVTWKKWCHQLKRGMIMAQAWVHGNPPQHGFVSGVWYQYVRISVSIWRLVHLFESDSELTWTCS